MTVNDLIATRRKTTIPRIKNSYQLYAARLVLLGELTKRFEYGVTYSPVGFAWGWDKGEGIHIPEDKDVVFGKMLELLHNLTLDFVLLADYGANQDARDANLALITKPDFWELAWQEDKQVQEEFCWRFWDVYSAISYLANQESDRNVLIVAFIGLCKYFGFSRADMEVHYQTLCERNEA